MDKNNVSYNDPAVVGKYKKMEQLEPGERTALHAIKGILRDAAVLDIGCGTGRTTLHIAGLSKDYVGIDYASGMIDYCRERFVAPNTQFFQCDARDMSRFPDNRFDIALFSFNGIDCISYNDRKRVLAEVARVLKSGGWFIFSSHNTRNLERKYRFRMPRNPFNLPQELSRLKQIRSLNGDISNFAGKDCFSLFDGAEGFRTQNVYCAPELQVKLLEDAGFGETRFIDIRTGTFITAAGFEAYTEPWLYYVTRLS
jgi:ubiquinone/menaquinone biosynthesis C-methylase UbiE